MKLVKKFSLGLLVSLHVIACGGTHKNKSTPSPTATNDIDLVDPAAVDLRSYVVFDQNVATSMKDSLQKDFSRIERYDLDTGTDNDKALMDLLQVKDLQAGSVTNWLKDRIHYLVNSDLSIYDIGFVVAADQQYKVEHFPADSDPESSKNVAAVMLGTALYNYAVKLKILHKEVNYLMIEINGAWVHANTQRNGVMQIGPALFDPNFQANKDADAYANTAMRVSTLYHEARHADGNSKAGSLGFSHIICPANAGVSAELVGKPACDSMANGAYTVGTAVLKAYVTKCSSLCSARDKAVLNAVLLDGLSRVVKPDGKTLPVLDAAPEAGFAKVDISSFTAVLAN